MRRVVVRTSVVSSPFGRLEVVVERLVVRLVKSDSKGVVVVVASSVVVVVSGMMGVEKLVTMRFTCRGK